MSVIVIREWEAHGVKCRIGGGLVPCGYVLAGPAAAGWQNELGDCDLEAHGGITYGPDKEGWVGFDAGHAGDLWQPAEWMPERMRQGVELACRFEGDPWGRRWTLDSLIAETERLAAQVAQRLRPA